MATRTSTPKKVRLACRRCRSRRIKCDGQVPACTNCAKAGQVCLDVDSQNSDVIIPRNFVGAARARIQWLENIIRERAPDVDLRSGPNVEPALGHETRCPNVGGDVEGEPSTAQTPAVTSPALQSIPSKRSADASEQPDHDGSVPERVHSVAVNLGMLSLNSDSPERHYLGSSSGLLFTNLIGASPSSAASTPQCVGDNTNAGGSEWQDTDKSSDYKTYYEALYASLQKVITFNQLHFLFR
ncbi:hypothetical protein ACHAP8_011640 [Fusarium lateritium]